MAAGIPDSLYWRCTPPEIDTLAAALTRRREAENRQAILCAGLVAAAVYNVNRRQGARMIQPGDFLPEEVVIVSPERATALFTGFAQSLGGN